MPDVVMDFWQEQALVRRIPARGQAVATRLWARQADDHELQLVHRQRRVPVGRSSKNEQERPSVCTYTDAYYRNNQLGLLLDTASHRAERRVACERRVQAPHGIVEGRTAWSQPVALPMTIMNFVTFNQDHSHLGVGMQQPRTLRGAA